VGADRAGGQAPIGYEPPLASLTIVQPLSGGAGRRAPSAATPMGRSTFPYDVRTLDP